MNMTQFLLTKDYSKNMAQIAREFWGFLSHFEKLEML